MAYKNEDQRKMAAVWRSPAWKKRKKELLDQNTRCEWCNGKSGVINHRKQGYYPGYELCLREEIDIICQPCHKEFTETGKKRPRLYDDCSSCEAVIFKGRKICFMCGSKTVQMLDVTPAKRARLLKILSRCPDVQIDDHWKKVWAWPDEISVLQFEKQDHLPWPMVKTDRGSVGLPAFMFGELLKRGAGASWKDTYVGDPELRREENLLQSSGQR